LKHLTFFSDTTIRVLFVVLFVIFVASFFIDYSSHNQFNFRLSTMSLLWLRVLLVILFVRFFLLQKVKILDSPRGIWLFAIIFFLWMTIVKVTQHLAFQTHAHDLGLFHSALWNSVNGKFMVDNIRQHIYFADHLIFFLIFLVPFYWIYSGPEVLLVASAVAFGLGLFLVYQLALERLRDRTLALLIAFAFGLNRYVWGAFLHEFHPDFFAPFSFFVWHRWAVTHSFCGSEIHICVKYKTDIPERKGTLEVDIGIERVKGVLEGKLV